MHKNRIQQHKAGHGEERSVRAWDNLSIIYWRAMQGLLGKRLKYEPGADIQLSLNKMRKNIW